MHNGASGGLSQDYGRARESSHSSYRAPILLCAYTCIYCKVMEEYDQEAVILPWDKRQDRHRGRISDPSVSHERRAGAVYKPVQPRMCNSLRGIVGLLSVTPTFSGFGQAQLYKPANSANVEGVGGCAHHERISEAKRDELRELAQF
ncbi:hypothetical protein TKK_0019485 [Trichogramma kaykai]